MALTAHCSSVPVAINHLIDFGYFLEQSKSRLSGDKWPAHLAFCYILGALKIAQAVPNHPIWSHWSAAVRTKRFLRQMKVHLLFKRYYFATPDELNLHFLSLSLSLKGHAQAMHLAGLKITPLCLNSNNLNLKCASNAF